MRFDQISSKSDEIESPKVTIVASVFAGFEAVLCDLGVSFRARAPRAPKREPQMAQNRLESGKNEEQLVIVEKNIVWCEPYFKVNMLHSRFLQNLA